MKLLVSVGIILPFIFLARDTKAQSADSIVNNYVNAIGGKDSISKINTIYQEASVSVMGTQAPDTIYIANGVGYKNIIGINGQEIIQCYNDSSGWTINPMGGSGDPTPVSQQAYNDSKNEMNVGGALYNYASKGYTVQLQGMEMVDSVNAYKLLLTEQDSIQVTYYIDPHTFYILKMIGQGEMQGSQVQVTVNYSDYRKTDSGIVMPYQYDIVLGNFDLAYTINTIKFNMPMDPSIFAMPK
ncbi:MAG TPA: hypothetical protein VNE41_00830 [Chitinophagaceae bacterium]|nr:hypothetical protein [Chitinophagaceae bacterium]